MHLVTDDVPDDAPGSDNSRDAIKDSNSKKPSSRSDTDDLASTDCDSCESRSAPVSPSAVSNLSDEQKSADSSSSDEQKSSDDEGLSPTSKENKRRCSWADLAEEGEDLDDCWTPNHRFSTKEKAYEEAQSQLRPGAAEFVMDKLFEQQQTQATVPDHVKESLLWVKMLEGYDCWPYNRFQDPQNQIAQPPVVLNPPAVLSPPPLPPVQVPVAPPLQAPGHFQEPVAPPAPPAAPAAIASAVAPVAPIAPVAPGPPGAPVAPMAPVMLPQASPMAPSPYTAAPVPAPPPAPPTAPPSAPPSTPPIVNAPITSAPETVVPGSQQETLYRVAYIGGLDLRVEPSYGALRTGVTLRQNEVFAVSQEIVGPDARTYLRLCDGRGWAFDDSALIPHDPSVKKGGWAPLLQAMGCPPGPPAALPAPTMWPTTPTGFAPAAPGAWIPPQSPQRMFCLSACV